MSAWFRRCSATFLIVISGVIAAPVALAETTYSFNLPEQSLADSLRAIGQQTEMNILFEPDAVKNARSPALKGQYTVDEAIRLVLAGTKLEAQHTAASNVVIKLKAARSTALPATSVDAPGTSGTRLAQSNSAGPQSQSTTGPQNVDTSVSTSELSKKEDLSEIIVTGTHIRNADPISPVMTITHADLLDQGYQTVSDAFQQLPQNFKGAASAESNPFNGVGSGSSENFTFANGVNLRGLGPSATLTLLNGRRVAPSPSSSIVDISAIPVSAIDHIDILTDGASAVYGSDAIGGVVNIVTRKDYSGFEVGGRANTITDGKPPNYGGDVLGGYSWSGGNALVSFDYEKDNPLLSQDRSFTAALPIDTSLLPRNEKWSLYSSVNQELTDRLSLTGDALLTQRQFFAQEGVAPGAQVSTTGSGTVHQLSTSLQVDYKLGSEWDATLVGQLAKEHDYFQEFQPQSGRLSTYTPNDYTLYSIEPRLDGKLFDTWGGSARLALGGEFRHEEYNEIRNSGTIANPVSTITPINASRHVSSAFAELLIPFVGKENAVPLVQQLRMNLSGRYDDFSDFGHTTNPKIALQWVPVDGVSIHSSAGRSFQAPTLFEASNVFNYAYYLNVPDPKAASGSSNILETYTSGVGLGPETAKTFNGGITFEPAFLKGLKVDLSYFYIDFKNEIINIATLGYFTNVLTDEAALGSLVERDPTASQINAILDYPGRTVFNGVAGYCTLGTPSCPSFPRTGIAAIALTGLTNASSAVLKGVDFSAKYLGEPTRFGRFRSDLDGTFMLSYQQRITPGAPETSPLNTLFNPLRFRAKANIGWDERGWGVNGRVNFTNAYDNTNAYNPNCPGATTGCRIGAWTTVDLSLAYATPSTATGPFSGVRVGLDVMNVFNRAPPFLSSLPGYYPYDGTNANPLLRTIGVTASKKW